MISTVGFLVGAELELARLEQANSTLAEQLQARKIVERAKDVVTPVRKAFALVVLFHTAEPWRGG